MQGNALIAHGGGPTPVINASLVGAIEEAAHHDAIRTVYGARSGLAGILAEDFLDLSAQSRATLEAVAVSPGSAIGSSRRVMQPDDFARLIGVFRRHDIRYFFYTGGNGSMDTAWRVEQTARTLHWDLRVIGIPKTIDNDLHETDHTPGYASCARFFALAVRDIGADNEALPAPIQVVEVLGRNAGWVTAATCLARVQPDDAPHLVYCPELPLTRDKLLADVETVYRRLGRVVLTVCEGQTDETGNFFGNADLAMDPNTRGKLPGNLGHVVAKTIWSGLGVRARHEKPGLLGRSSAVTVPELDRTEARACGRAAVRAAVAGESGVMVALRRVPGSAYQAATTLVPLEKVALTERLFPREWINAAGNDIEPAFREWAMPLIGEIPPHGRLW